MPELLMESKVNSELTLIPGLKFCRSKLMKHYDSKWTCFQIFKIKGFLKIFTDCNWHQVTLPIMFPSSVYPNIRKNSTRLWLMRTFFYKFISPFPTSCFWKPLYERVQENIYDKVRFFGVLLQILSLVTGNIWHNRNPGMRNVLYLWVYIFEPH